MFEKLPDTSQYPVLDAALAAGIRSCGVNAVGVIIKFGPLFERPGAVRIAACIAGSAALGAMAEKLSGRNTQQELDPGISPPQS